MSTGWRVLAVSCLLLARSSSIVAQVRPRISTGASRSSISIGPIQEDPQVIQEQMRRGCLARIEQARAALAEGRIYLASQHLNIARGLAVDQSLADELSALFTQLNRMGYDLIEQADKQYTAGQYPDALKTYQTVLSALGQLPSGQLASRRLTEAEQDPHVRAAAQEVRAEGLYKTVTTRLDGYWLTKQRRAAAASQPATSTSSALDEPAGQPVVRPHDAKVIQEMPIEAAGEVIATLRTIVKLYGRSTAGVKAAAVLEVIEDDSELMAALRAHEEEQVVKVEFEKARLYHTNKLYKQAAEFYRKLIEDHPKSSLVEEARKGLAEVTVLLERTPAKP